jgi:hypothetical protein
MYFTGTKVICLNEDGWRKPNGSYIPGPKKGDICTVSGKEDDEHILIEGWSSLKTDGYHISEFRPQNNSEKFSENVTLQLELTFNDTDIDVQG